VNRRSRKKHQSQSDNYSYNIKGSRRDKTEDVSFSNLQDKEAARTYLEVSNNPAKPQQKKPNRY